MNEIREERGRTVALLGPCSYQWVEKALHSAPALGVIIQNTLLELGLTIYFNVGAWLNNYTSQLLCKPA